MSIQHIMGECGRMWVSSASHPDQQHLVDLLEHECGCPSFTCRNRKYRQQYGHNFTCRHIKEAREAFLEDVLDSLRQHHLSK